MTGAHSRRKGAQFERDTANALKPIFPDAHRGLQSAGERVPDVDGCPPLWVECKVGQRTNIKAALRQAEGSATPGRVPVAVCRDDRQEATVTMRWGDWCEIVSVWWEVMNDGD